MFRITRLKITAKLVTSFTQNNKTALLLKSKLTSWLECLNEGRESHVQLNFIKDYNFSFTLVIKLNLKTLTSNCISTLKT